MKRTKGLRRSRLKARGPLHGPQYEPYTWEERRVRFWARVDKTPTCWNWLGAIGGGGYGCCWDGTRQTVAHRLAWRFEVGPIPDGLLACHHCDNRRCVRPDHLFLGTYSDNEYDKYAKGRDNNVLAKRMAAKTHCVRGHPFTAANTYRDPDGKRECRECRCHQGGR